MIVVASSSSNLLSAIKLSISPHFDLLEEPITSRAALYLFLKKEIIDVLLVDLDLLTDSGIQEISELRSLQPKMRIVILAKKINPKDEIGAVLFGAKAFCNHDTPPQTFIKIIKAVLKDEVWVDRLFVTRLLAEIEDISHLRKDSTENIDSAISKLTPRESQIANYIAGGESNKSISELLNISERTVKAHLGVIFRKMGLNDRLQLALYISRHQQLAKIWQENRHD